MLAILFACLAVVGLLTLFGAPRRAARGGAAGPLLAPAGPPEQPINFGYKSRWLAVACDDPDRVIAALALANVEPSGWPDGIAAAHQPGHGCMFVSPPIEGTWVLVVGADLAEPGAALVELVERLSRVLATEVQAFATHRVVDQHGWWRARAGKLLRAHAWSGARGEVVLDHGEPTSADEGLDQPDEEDVMHVAAAWSVDPSMLAAHPPCGTGWIGISGGGAKRGS